MSEKDLFVGALNDIYGEFLNHKQRRVISAYFDEDLSLGEIAENEGITRQAVLDLIKRTSAKLYEWEDKCGYYNKISVLRKLGGEVKNGNSDLLPKLIDFIDNF